MLKIRILKMAVAAGMTMCLLMTWPSDLFAQQKDENVVCVPETVARTCAEQDKRWDELVAGANRDAGRADQAERQLSVVMPKLEKAQRRNTLLQQKWAGRQKWYIWLGVGIVSGSVGAWYVTR